MNHEHNESLQSISGVGPRIAAELERLGISSVSDLQDKDPEELYERLQRISGEKVDRCVLYVLRCAVYYASNESHDPEMLKWWNWKDS